MLRQTQNNGKGESFCVDGDIKRVAGRLTEAAVAYIKGHVADPRYTEVHLEALTDNERDKIITILQEWLRSDNAQVLRKKLGVKNAADEIWKFIFTLKPETLTTCLNRIDIHMKEKRYQPVVDICTAIIEHSKNDAVPVLVQRAVAYTLIDGCDKQAISDCLRAFTKDKDGTVQVLRDKHGIHLPKISESLRKFVYSKPTPAENQQNEKWLKLTTDCCKLLLTLDSSNFAIQMTYVERLTAWSKLDQASTTLNETIRAQHLDPEQDQRKLAECWIRLGYCCFLKQQTETAISNLARGLNMPADSSIKNDTTLKGTKSNPSETAQKAVKPDFDVTRTFLEENYEIQHVAKVAREVLGADSTELNDICAALDKAASKLNSPEKTGTVMKLNNNIQQATEFYRAILVLKPRHRDTLMKLANCYSKLGRQNFSIKIYDYLLSKKDYAQDSKILSARATCYREIGKKVEARKDYDALLHKSPKDAALLFERSLVHLDNGDTDALLTDLQAACKSNQRTVSIYMNKLPLAQKTRIRQTLHERASSLLQYARHPDGQDPGPDSSTALAITQLMTKLNTKDHVAQIMKAHALYYVGNFDDAEVTLKRLLNDHPEVLKSHGEEVLSVFFREIPASERSILHPAAHAHAVEILQKQRDHNSVQHAAHCFTIAILCCAESAANLPEFRGSYGLCKSYLARAECIAHLGDQRGAMRDFTAAIEVNPTCVDGLCGRAFMRLALGEEQECVDDIISACGIDTATVTAHITALPQDARKILLYWLDQRVISLLVRQTPKDGESLSGSESTISITLEMPGKYPNDSSSPSSQTTSPIEYANETKSPSNDSIGSSPTKNESNHENSNRNVETHRRSQSDIIRNTRVGVAAGRRNVYSSQQETRVKVRPARRGFHKSSANLRNLKGSPNMKTPDELHENTSVVAITPSSSNPAESRPSTTLTTETSVSCEDVLSSVEKTERLLKAQTIGKLLIAVDPGNALRHETYADILILKGDFEEGLRHLQIVMQMDPTDITAIARAGLINAKQNRYQEAAHLLSTIMELDNALLLFVLKALDSAGRRKLSEEAYYYAVALSGNDEYRKAIDYFGLSLCSSDDKRPEKLRLRAICFTKLKNTKRALEDMTTVIRETAANSSAVDYCARAHIHLLDNKDKEACSDYSKALKIDRKEACLLIHSKPGRGPLGRVFHRQALEEFICHNFEECMDLCENGIMIDNNNVELRKLRARVRKEIGTCVIQ